MGCCTNDRQIAIVDSEFFFAPNARTSAQARQIGFDKYCAIEKAGSSVETDTKTKRLPCRGAMTEVKNTNRLMALMYQLTLAEVGPKAIQLQYFADRDYNWGAETADNTQSALAAIEGNPYNFDIANSGNAYTHNRWLPVLTTAGVEITDLEVLTLVGTQSVYGPAGNSTTLVEGIDFEVDHKSGLFRLSRSVSDDVITPHITCQEILQTSEEYMKKYKVFSKPTMRGIGRLQLFDEDDLFVKHDDFFCEVKVTEGWQASEDFATVGVEVKVLDINQSSNIYCRPDVDFLGNNL